jgi:hypothetical protein
MSMAIQQIVSSYVRLRDRSALEKLRTYRQGLVDDFNKAGLGNFDASLSLQNLVADVATIDAGFKQLDQPGER